MNSDLAIAGPTDGPDPLPPQVRGVLEEVRGRIRRFVILQGILLVLIWLGISYWVVLGLDRIPVWMGLSELSFVARLILLVAIVSVVGWLLYRQIFLRLIVPLRPGSLALLLERRFPDLGDSLATLVHQEVENTNPDGDFGGRNRIVLNQRLQEQAVDKLNLISVRELFNYPLLIRTGLLALITLGGIGWLAVTQPETFSTSLRRLYLLEPVQWPRECHVELAGLRVQNSRGLDAIPEMTATREFRDGEISVAAGSSLSILARAESPSSDNPRRRIPEQCLFQFRSDDGKRGTMPMNPVGAARDGFQWYAVDGQILEGIVGELQFDVRADDHRIGPFRIRSVPAPMLVNSRLDLVYPDYLVDVESSRWTPRTIPYTSGMRIPQGTTARLVAESNRAIDEVFVVDAEEKIATEISASPDDNNCVTMDLGNIADDLRLDIYLLDECGVMSQSPTNIVVGTVEDNPPEVKFRLSGIGTAVTPNVRIPIAGLIVDDYQIKSAWTQLVTPITVDGISVPVDINSRGEISGAVDFLELRRQGVLPTALPVTEGSRLSLTVMADDYCDLGEETNTGVGQQYSLDIVTPAALLRILERLEADQRRRLEQIYDELTQARDNLARSRSTSAGNLAGVEPGDSRPNDLADMEEDWPLRQLFVQRSLLQAQKSMQEISAAANSFDEIRGQLINNRIDAEDRKSRIADDIVKPLRGISDQSMPLLESALIDLDRQYRQIMTTATTTTQTQAIDEASEESLVLANSILAEIQAVLGAMLKFETQNELLEIVRQLLKQEQELLERTRALREREAFDDIFNQ